MENRWGPTSIRRFLQALIVPRVDKTYDAVLGLTPEEFDAAFGNTQNADSGLSFADVPLTTGTASGSLQRL